ncbi:MAG: bifunctional cytidylyltransferase/SDR family oxidoreductase [Bacteroidales bacterium]|nr:bifunctional cytidylyltransferase/SDR family oxidoreductase [Bacteroidales bacterium]
MKNIAVILAGGSGARMDEPIPKQFLKVAGKKVIEHTIDVFEQNKNIDDIIIVSKAEYIPEVEQLIINNQYTKVRKVLQGGEERYHSSLAAINAGENEKDNLIFHDAVRPLVNKRIVDDCIQALETYQAVDVAIKTTDTIIEVNQEDLITSIPLRAKLRNGQTPQCFKRGLIKKAYEIALNDPYFITTDDCGVVKKYLPDTPIYVVEGEVFNMKLTYREDLFLLDKLFQLKSISDNRVLNENAIKELKGKVMVVFGGSYGIGEEVVKLAKNLGAKVYSFSRTQNNIDVSNDKDIKKVLAEIAHENGHIDYVVCTAGLLVKEALYSMSYNKIIHSVNVNFIGSINVAKESYAYLKDSKGSLLLYTSSSYTRGRMLYSIYSSTKAAIVNLVQALSEEWFSFGIRINCLNPERTKTPMRTKSFGNEPEETLLNPEVVAIASVNTLTSSLTGEVIDIRK